MTLIFDFLTPKSNHINEPKYICYQNWVELFTALHRPPGNFLAERGKEDKKGRGRKEKEGYIYGREERGLASKRVGWICPLKCGCLRRGWLHGYVPEDTYILRLLPFLLTIVAVTSNWHVSLLDTS